METATVSNFLIFGLFFELLYFLNGWVLFWLGARLAGVPLAVWNAVTLTWWLGVAGMFLVMGANKLVPAHPLLVVIPVQLALTYLLLWRRCRISHRNALLIWFFHLACLGTLGTLVLRVLGWFASHYQI